MDYWKVGFPFKGSKMEIDLKKLKPLKQTAMKHCVFRLICILMEFLPRAFTITDREKQIAIISTTIKSEKSLFHIADLFPILIRHMARWKPMKIWLSVI
jgi:hypothetical protein